MDKIKSKLAKWKSEELVIWMILVSGFLLFLPKAMWRSDALLNLRNEFEVYLSLLFIGSISYVLARLLIEKVEAWLASKRLIEQEQGIVQMLNNLDHIERSVLREFILQKTNRLSLPVDEAAVKNLIDTKILQYSDGQKSDSASAYSMLSINILARPYLTYRILGLPVGSLTEEQKQALKNARPRFLTPDGQVSRTHNGKIFRLRTHVGKSKQAA